MYWQEKIPERLSDASLARRKAKQKRTYGEYVAGPIPVRWLTIAGALPGKALAVGMAVWFLHGLDRVDKSLAPSMLTKFGVSRRAGYRGLAALERAGLVRVDRTPGRCARVEIIKRPSCES